MSKNKKENKKIILAINDLVLGGLIEDALSVHLPEIVVFSGKFDDDTEGALIVSDSLHNMKDTNETIYLVNTGQGVSSEISKSAQHNVLFLPVRMGSFLKKIRKYMEGQTNVHERIKLDIGAYTLNLAESILELKASNETIRLTEKEQDILQTLYEAKDKTIERKDLLEAVWGYADGVETHTLETHIYRLRQKIEKDPANPEILLTKGSKYKISG